MERLCDAEPRVPDLQRGAGPQGNRAALQTELDSIAAEAMSSADTHLTAEQAAGVRAIVAAYAKGTATMAHLATSLLLLLPGATQRSWFLPSAPLLSSFAHCVDSFVTIMIVCSVCPDALACAQAGERTRALWLRSAKCACVEDASRRMLARLRAAAHADSVRASHATGPAPGSVHVGGAAQASAGSAHTQAALGGVGHSEAVHLGAGAQPGATACLHRNFVGRLFQAHFRCHAAAGLMMRYQVCDDSGHAVQRCPPVTSAAHKAEGALGASKVAARGATTSGNHSGARHRGRCTGRFARHCHGFCRHFAATPAGRVPAGAALGLDGLPQYAFDIVRLRAVVPALRNFRNRMNSASITYGTGAR